jgi:hypothetical protein
MHVVLLFFFIENHMGANYFRECSLSVCFTAQLLWPLEETKNKESANSCIHHIDLCQMYAYTNFYQSIFFHLPFLCVYMKAISKHLIQL